MALTSCSTTVHGYAIPIYITSYKIRSINHKYNTLSCPRTNVLLHRPYQVLNQIRLYATKKREASALVYYENRDPAAAGSLANLFRCTEGTLYPSQFRSGVDVIVGVSVGGAGVFVGAGV